jgi:hypothetical protein
VSKKLRLSTNKERDEMPPKSPVKEDEGKKTVNLAHYALVLANKKISMLSQCSDQSSMDDIISNINALIVNECGFDLDDFFQKVDRKEITLSEDVSVLLSGMLRLIAKQVEALKIVSTYNIEV